MQGQALSGAEELRHELARLLEAGMGGLDEGAPDDAAGPALVAIYLVYGRPALPIRSGALPVFPTGWEVLTSSRASIERCLPSIGRIDCKLDGTDAFIGTGFMTRYGVMTASHVASDLGLPREGAGNRTGARAWIDWRQEAENPTAFARVPLVSIRWQDPDLDVAVLEIGTSGEEPAGLKLPPPLALETSAPESLAGELVATVGYPETLPKDLALEEIVRIFPGLLKKKRFMPGRLRAPAIVEGELLHDCSTLGGASGAPLLLLSGGEVRVIGMHLSGATKQANYARPTWQLQCPLTELT